MTSLRRFTTLATVLVCVITTLIRPAPAPAQQGRPSSDTSKRIDRLQAEIDSILKEIQQLLAEGSDPSGDRESKPAQPVVADAKGDPLSGEWTVRLVGDRVLPEAADSTMTLKLHEDGTVTGTYYSADFASNVRGTYNAESGDLELSVNTPQGVAGVVAKVQGGALQGEAQLEGGFQAELSGERKPIEPIRRVRVERRAEEEPPPVQRQRAQRQEPPVREERAEQDPPTRRVQVRRNRAGQGGQLMAQMLERFDTNGDGKLQRSEAPEQMAQFFDQFDANGDGVIEPSEIGAIMGGTANPPAVRVQTRTQPEPPSDPVSGEWEVRLVGDMVPPGTEAFTIKLQLGDDGEVRGSTSTPQFSGEFADGSFDRETGELKLTFSNESMELAWTARIEGDTITGQMGTETFSIKFEGKRKATAPETQPDREPPAPQPERQTRQRSRPQGDAPGQEDDLDRARLEKEFAESLTNATLVGSFRMLRDGGISDPREEKYSIVKAEKVTGDNWVITARVEYGNADVSLPIPLRVLWAGDTAVITVTNMDLPGLGRYSARVMVWNGIYSGGWFGVGYGGTMAGRIVKDDGGEEPAVAVEEPAVAVEEPTPTLRTNKPIGRQDLTYVFEQAEEEIPYSLFVPVDYTDARAYPLIVALHGLGGTGRQFIRTRGLTDLAEEHDYIVVAPMGYSRDGWYGMQRRRRSGGEEENVSGLTKGELSEKDVMNVLALIRTEYRIDPDRIYLMGHSMGGGGTYHLGGKYAEIWAALAPIAPAYSGFEILGQIKGLPVMVVHGAKDRLVPVRGSRNMVERMKALGMTYEYVEDAEAGHGGSDIVAPKLPGIFEFFNRHRREDGAVREQPGLDLDASGAKLRQAA